MEIMLFAETFWKMRERGDCLPHKDILNYIMYLVKHTRDNILCRNKLLMLALT